MADATITVKTIDADNETLTTKVQEILGSGQIKVDIPGDATNVNIAVSLEIGGTEMQTVSKFYDTGNNLLSTHNATIQNNGNTGFSVPSIADTMTVDASS